MHIGVLAIYSNLNATQNIPKKFHLCSAVPPFYEKEKKRKAYATFRYGYDNKKLICISWLYLLFRGK